jgi:O-antigen ligase
MRSESPRRWILPVFLVVCLLMGGSAQGIWNNVFLQVSAAAILAWASVTRRSDDPSAASRQLMALVLITAVVIAFHLVPLPPGVWTSFPGRRLVAEGFTALGYSLPAQSVSLTPYASIAAALAALPAVAALVTTIRVRQRESWLAAAVLLAVLAAVLLGALQVASGGPERSSWYLYPHTNSGAVGFFANSNHMGSLLLVSVPFASALLAAFARRSKSRSPLSGTIAIGIAMSLLILGGIALNRSLAAVGLLAPVLVFSMMLLPAGSTVRRLALLGGTVALVACILFLTSSPITGEISGADLRSVETRSGIWSSTIELVRQTFPLGTGLGSFEIVYPLTEDPAQVRSMEVNHAHNDYLEVLLELGLAGAVLVVLFLVWWLVQAVRIWRSGLSTIYARAATIASGALLAHSVVDYPLRTAALSAIFAVCLGLMAQPRIQQRSSDSRQVRPTKHVSLG